MKSSEKRNYWHLPQYWQRAPPGPNTACRFYRCIESMLRQLQSALIHTSRQVALSSGGLPCLSTCITLPQALLLPYQWVLARLQHLCKPLMSLVISRHGHAKQGINHSACENADRNPAPWFQTPRTWHSLDVTRAEATESKSPDDLVRPLTTFSASLHS